MKRFKETEGLVALEQLWRRHFLDSMSPKFMPELWDVNHNANRLEIRASEGRVDAEDLEVAGVDAVIVPKEVKVVVTSPNESLVADQSQNNKEDDDVDTSSDWDFRSAAGSRNSSVRNDLDKTLTDDDRYFSDATSVRSFYETIRSDGSTIDDFQSFASSLTEKQFGGSDEGSQSSLCSQDFSEDSETEVEDDPSAKMEM